jgi:gliding motility-associated-like protein
MKDPVPPPPSVLGSNAPLCPGYTLHLTSTNPATPLTYRWVGPNGFTSNQQNADVPSVTEASEGVYSLTVSRVNCDATSSIEVIINPAAHLTDVTPDQAMPYGGFVQLNASGVLLYTWGPNNGSLSNPNIYNPKAAPDTATTYTVFGMNEFGCRDSAKVNITINYDAYGSVPSAFSPNGDGHNDIFRVINQKFVKIIDFSIYNRWGKRVYHNNYDPNAGWDGTFNGVPQDIGVYFYHIVIETPTRQVLDMKGDITLIR